MAKTQKNLSSDPRGLSGFGGWMIFPVGGLFLYVFLSSLALILGIFSEAGIDVFAFVFYLIMILYSIYVLVKAFKKKKSFPFYFIFWLWLGLALNLLLLSYLGEGIFVGDLLYVIAPIIWTFYIKKSKRVKNTFIN